MNNTKILLKTGIGVFLISLVFFMNKSLAQQKVEGIHYATGKPVRVIIENGKIQEIKNLKKLSNEKEKVFIAPGFFDSQINGFAGVSFSLGGGVLTEEGVRKATHELWKRGVTSYLPTLTTNSKEVLIRNFTVLARVKNEAAILGSIPGYHLEGPYISPLDGFRGAHSKRFIRKPDWSEFLELNQAAGGNILTVTVAPEIEGAMDFIKKCTENGIVVSLGHHNGNVNQINEAVQNGAKTCTHLGNGCANMINRHNNPLWPQLANDKLMVSLICDGFHLRPEEIKVFYKVKGRNKTIIISDVTKYAGLKPGLYKNIDGEDIELTTDGKVQYPAQQVLAGSASSIDKGVAHIIEVTGCSLYEAIKMASENPAKLYGITDRGTLDEGKRADIILFTLKNSKIEIQKTFVKGEMVFSAN